MKERFYGHKVDIQNKESKPAATHFNSQPHDIFKDLRIALIKSGFGNDPSRKNKKPHYISKFNLLAPFGINALRGSLH